ncbi:nickel pincer cofactor biosynthesis protein LarB [Alkalibacter rhizosphaerae]|uniref:Nickel pincer cofactor biosynthesis protein LarB n=1 Tax=Alkalibacter rhizosphaerae TaxID=2815577 RepID=A0A974XG00_9FIRM|nr:nickel pincer cofactor biosynthesis protein LarB [Alkalibacter rhizosphaerae]QSX09118.1 nickel pincer cofactor biosynthesis protein LarB [Alkalibacter rhizosphaerae]
MDKKRLEQLLEEIQSGKTSVEEGVRALEDLPYKELGYATIDNHRELRNGYPEVIYCQGKTPEQVQGIVKYMMSQGNNILATRAGKEMYRKVREVCNHAHYNELGRTITIINHEPETTESYIAIVAAGTSDLPVVEEAYETALILGNQVEKITDVGVAGLHRLMSKMDRIRGAKVVVVIAGMEGALASVIGGMVDKPVIAVPTSVGYGANFGGLAALLAMLNSCASGVSVVNIDNGFGAAYNASIINKL